jgi:hypothetical protein
MAPPRKKPRSDAGTKHGTGAAAAGATAAAGALPVTSPQTQDPAVVHPSPSEPADETSPSQAGNVDDLHLALVSFPARLPRNPTTEDIHSGAVPLSHISGPGPVLLMLPSAWALKSYEDSQGTTYSVNINLGRELQSGRVAHALVTVQGTIDSITTRMGESLPTMRLRLDPADHEHVQKLGAKVVQRLSSPEAVRRMLQTNNKNKNKRRTKCTFGHLTGAFPDALWFNRYVPQDMLVYSINPSTGNVLRRPEWWGDKPIDGPQYEGLPVRVMCSITAKVTAPLHEQPQPKAVVKLQFRMHEIVFLGGERPPVHRTSIESLGLVMDDDAPIDDETPS